MGATAVRRRAHGGGRAAARAVPGGHLPRREGSRGPGVPSGRAAGIPDPRRRPGEQLDLARLRAGGADVRPGVHAAALRHPATSGRAAGKPHARPGNVSTPLIQHCYQLHHRNQLAGVRRGKPGQLPGGHGRAGGRAVHRGCHRAVGGTGRHPRHLGTCSHDRQLLGGSHPEPGARLRPPLGPRRAGAGGPGSGPEFQRLSHCYHAHGRDPAGSRRAGRLDGGHQAARHERRQLLRRRRRASVRESHRIHQHVRPAAGHRAPVRHSPHVRPARRQAAAGIRHGGGHGHPLPRPYRGLDGGRGARQPSAAGDCVPGGEQRQPRRHHGREGDPVRPGRVRADDRRDHGNDSRRHRFGRRQLHPGRGRGSFRRHSARRGQPR